MDTKIKCETCGSYFEVTPSRAKEARFCSWSCRYKSATPSRRQSVESKLDANVECRGSNECWPWRGYHDVNGYGKLQVRGKGMLAHRLYFEYKVGKIPRGMDLLHTCDNPPCCNPRHLRVGTHQENMRDMVSKGRHAHGERSAKSVMTLEQVSAIRATYRAGGISMRAAGIKHGVNPETAKQMLIGVTWRYD